MYGWYIVTVRYHPIPMGRYDFNTIPNMNMVLLVLQITRALWRTGKAVIMDSIYVSLKDSWG